MVTGIEPDGAPQRAPSTVAEPFDEFFRREYPRLVALVAALTGSLPAGEDIAQEALLRAHQRWERLSRFDKPGAWTRRVALNLASNAGRRSRSERRAVERLAARPVAVVLPVDVDEFWQSVRRLPRQQAAAIALHYLEDRSVVDVAEVLDCAEGTAKVHLHRGRAALAALLAPDPTGGPVAGRITEER